MVPSLLLYYPNMADIFTKEKRSEIMSKIRSESMLEKEFARKLAKVIYPLGYRYRKNYKRIFGKPDIAFVSRKIAVFVDGDFWHGYRFEQRKKKLTQEFWIAKIENNMRRDRRNRRLLTKHGWKYVRFWEHEVKKRPERCIQKVLRLLTEERSNI